MMGVAPRRRKGRGSGLEQPLQQGAQLRLLGPGEGGKQPRLGRHMRGDDAVGQRREVGPEALERITGIGDVRQGKRFELEVDDTVDDVTLERIAEELLTNTVIENFNVSRVSE